VELCGSGLSVISGKPSGVGVSLGVGDRLGVGVRLGLAVVVGLGLLVRLGVAVWLGLATMSVFVAVAVKGISVVGIEGTVQALRIALVNTPRKLQNKCFTIFSSERIASRERQ
jgi:hypothetical protein